MNFDRAVIRHTCYRRKNQQPYKPEYQQIIDVVESKLDGRRWDDFADNWDVFVSRGGNITVIEKEMDESFIKSTCIKIKTVIELGLSVDEVYDTKLTTREQNIVDIIKLNYSGEDVEWNKYDVSWGIRVDHNLKEFAPYKFKTKVNTVKFPEPPVVEEREEPQPTEVKAFDEMTPEEVAKFKRILEAMG